MPPPSGSPSISIVRRPRLLPVTATAAAKRGRARAPTPADEGEGDGRPNSAVQGVGELVAERAFRVRQQEHSLGADRERAPIDLARRRDPRRPRRHLSGVPVGCGRGARPGPGRRPRGRRTASSGAGRAGRARPAASPRRRRRGGAGRRAAVRRRWPAARPTPAAGRNVVHAVEGAVAFRPARTTSSKACGRNCRISVSSGNPPSRPGDLSAAKGYGSFRSVLN